MHILEENFKWHTFASELFIYTRCIKLISWNLREVGPPPNTKRRQNSLNRLCSVCAVKKIVCAAVFLDIQIIFIGHSEVTQPPHILQIHLK